MRGEKCCITSFNSEEEIDPLAMWRRSDTVPNLFVSGHILWEILLYHLVTQADPATSSGAVMTMLNKKKARKH